MDDAEISEVDRLPRTMPHLQRGTACHAAGEPVAADHGLDWPNEPITDLRWVALHLIEETARHAGRCAASWPTGS
ncbi:MAG: DUF664 domain-containing protein [Mycobacterium sp.]|nr:DUF664 domain-containing protein [Mycobacterium sp.]